MLKILSCLCVLLLILPLHAVGEELTQLYLERSGRNDYTSYLAALGSADAVADAVELYASVDGTSLAEGEQFSFRVTIPQDMFGYPLLTYAMTSNNILDNGFTLMVDGELPYAECSTLTLDSLWTQSGTFSKDRYGILEIKISVGLEHTSRRADVKSHPLGLLPLVFGKRRPRVGDGGSYDILKLLGGKLQAIGTEGVGVHHVAARIVVVAVYRPDDFGMR